jgi:hypothetical protein
MPPGEQPGDRCTNRPGHVTYAVRMYGVRREGRTGDTRSVDGRDGTPRVAVRGGL